MLKEEEANFCHNLLKNETFPETFKSHMRTNTGKRPYSCDVPGCGYAAAKSGALKAHMRTHTGERPYACDVPGCGYSATQSSALKRHKLTHAE